MRGGHIAAWSDDPNPYWDQQTPAFSTSPKAFWELESSRRCMVPTPDFHILGPRGLSWWLGRTNGDKNDAIWTCMVSFFCLHIHVTASHIENQASPPHPISDQRKTSIISYHIQALPLLYAMYINVLYTQWLHLPLLNHYLACGWILQEMGQVGSAISDVGPMCNRSIIWKLHTVGFTIWTIQSVLFPGL